MTRARRRGGHRGRRANAGLDAGITLPAAVLALAALTATSAAAQSLLTGPVTHVRDGDTIEIGAGSGPGARAGAWAVRLEGLHAPERGTPAGERAAAWMRRTPLGRTATWRSART